MYCKAQCHNGVTRAYDGNKPDCYRSKEFSPKSIAQHACQYDDNTSIDQELQQIEKGIYRLSSSAFGYRTIHPRNVVRRAVDSVHNFQEELSFIEKS